MIIRKITLCPNGKGNQDFVNRFTDEINTFLRIPRPGSITNLPEPVIRFSQQSTPLGQFTITDMTIFLSDNDSQFSALCKQLKLKYSPNIEFMSDETLETETKFADFVAAFQRADNWEKSL